MSDLLRDCLRQMPLIAILRGMKPEEAPAVLETLVAAGFPILEVPLNSPRPLESIAYLVRHAPPGVLIGAGTVLTEADVADVAATGAKLMIAPNCAPPVIAAAKARGLIALARRRDPDRGLRSAGGRGGWAQDVSRRAACRRPP